MGGGLWNDPSAKPTGVEYALAVVDRYFDLSAKPTALRVRMFGRSLPFRRRRVVGGGLWNDPSAKPTGVEYALPSSVDNWTCQLYLLPCARGCSVAHYRFGGSAWWAAVCGTTRQLNLPDRIRPAVVGR